MTHEMVTAPSGIAYPIWRFGYGTPLLLLHGFTGSHQAWQPLINRLPDGHQVVTLDLPGHGYSSLPDAQSWAFASVLDDLAWIIESLLGGNADVLGYSMGGRLALALAVTHPWHVRSLIMESGSPGIANEQERRMRQEADEQLAERIVRDGLPAFIGHWERLPMWESQAALPEAACQQQRQIRMGHSPHGLAANLRATGSGAQPSYWEDLADLRIPTLLIAGDLDQKFAGIAGRMYEALPDSRLEIAPNAGHAVHLEQPDWFVERVSQFLAEAVIHQSATKEKEL